MPTLEPDFELAETAVLEAAETGHLSPEQIEVLRGYFAKLEKEVLAAYQADRNTASRMYDVEEIAQFWRREMDWFAAQVETVQQFQSQLRQFGIDDPDLEPILRNVRDAYEAAGGHYHMHA